jgi:predicted PurR-regulated permease PerM
MENNLKQNDPDYVTKSLEVTIKIGLVIGLIAWCFIILKPFLMLTLWGLILAVAMFPLFALLKRWFGNRNIIPAILVTVSLLAVILVPVFLLGSSLSDAVIYVKEALSSGKSIIPPPTETVKSWPVIGPSVYEFWQKTYENVAEVAIQYRDQLTAGFTWFLGAMSNAGMGFLMFLASIIISGVMLVFSEQAYRGCLMVAARLMGKRGEEMVGMAEVTIRNVARGIIGVAFIQAFLAGIGFLAAGIPGAGLWALLSFFLAIVQIGVGPVLIVVLIYAFIKLSTLTAVLLLIWSIIPMAIDNVLKPILLGRNAPVPTLVVFLGAIGGFISFGMLGLFVGAVVLSLGYDLFLVWLKTGAE